MKRYTLTPEIIERFRLFRDDKEAFKSEYAKNQSYVAAYILHDLIFSQNSTTLIIVNEILKAKIRSEMLTIVSNIEFDKTFILPLISFDFSESIQCPELGGKILFRTVKKYGASDAHYLRGWTVGYVYYGDDVSHMRQYSPWMVPTEIPGLLANSYYKK